MQVTNLPGGEGCLPFGKSMGNIRCFYVEKWLSQLKYTVVARRDLLNSTLAPLSLQALNLSTAMGEAEAAFFVVGSRREFMFACQRCFLHVWETELEPGTVIYNASPL